MVLALLLLGVALMALTPTGRYLARGAWEEGKILWHRRAISELIADPATPPALTDKLKLVLDARRFAADSLGLDAKQSFTTFSQTGHDTLTLVVSGAYRDKLKSYTWWFPVVGRVPYKGYFDFDEARRQERLLHDRGFDTRLGAVSAFLRNVLPQRWQTTENMDAGKVRRVVMLKPSKDMCLFPCRHACGKRVIATVSREQQSFVLPMRHMH